MVRGVFFLLILFFYLPSEAKVAIRGKILQYDGKSRVYYRSTIEGIYTPYGNEIKPSSSGTFLIEFESEGIGNITLGYKSILYRFFHDVNSKINLEIDESKIVLPKRIQGVDVTDRYFIIDSVKQVATKLISGDHESINKFYNRSIRTSYSTTRAVGGNYFSKLIYEAPSPKRAMLIIDSLIRLELNQINQLPWRLETENQTLQKKEDENRQFLINEVHAFYNGIFLNGMFLKRKEQGIKSMNDSTAIIDIYNRDWEILIEKLADETAKNLKPTPNSNDYNDFMESLAYTLSAYKQYGFPQNPSSLDETVIDRLFKHDTILFSDKKSRFAYELSGLQRFLNDQLFYSPALLIAVYDLQKKYPNSANLGFYKPQIEKLRANLEIAQHEFKGGKIINSNYNLLNDLLKRFEGKNVLIDIWATWCHPCIEDFKSKSTIQPFIDTQRLEILYISIDKPEWEDRWRQSIKINQLAGYHFRANSKFITDMWNVMGDFQGAIPRYVLIDKTGKIYKSTAARPSMGEALPAQIEELINRID